MEGIVNFEFFLGADGISVVVLINLAISCRDRWFKRVLTRVEESENDTNNPIQRDINLH